MSVVGVKGCTTFVLESSFVAHLFKKAKTHRKLWIISEQETNSDQTMIITNSDYDDARIKTRTDEKQDALKHLLFLLTNADTQKYLEIVCAPRPHPHPYPLRYTNHPKVKVISVEHNPSTPAEETTATPGRSDQGIDDHWNERRHINR